MVSRLVRYAERRIRKGLLSDQRRERFPLPTALRALERAEQNLKNGLNLLGEHELLYTGLGYVYYQYHDSGVRIEEKYLKKLQDCIEKIFKSNPDSANGYLLSGLLKLKKENAHNAYRDFKRSYELNPNNPENLIWLFFILNFHLGRNLLAAPLIKKVFEIDPLSPSIT